MENQENIFDILAPSLSKLSNQNVILASNLLI